MYLSDVTHKLQAVSNAAATTTEPTYVVSYQDITISGIAFPQSSGQGLLTGTTDIDIVPSPVALQTRQLKELTIYNSDSVAHDITIFKDVSGVNFPIVKASLLVGETLKYNIDDSWSIFSQAGELSTTISEFIANGTYTPKAKMKYALVAGVGAGGGGGSGTRQPIGNNAFGGSGGAGACIVWRLITKGEFSTTVPVTIGAAGVGGTAISVNATNGNPGTAGGDTFFGTFIQSKGGGLGAGGLVTAPASSVGGQAPSCIPAYGPYALTGSNGGGGQTTANGAGATGLQGGNACPAGSGGGGINAANTPSTGTYNGGAVFNNGVSVPGGTFGLPGTSNAALSLFFHVSLVGQYGIGSGGGGGRPGAVDGGAAGNYGAGGGGGSGVRDGTVSGAGGNGGGGLVTILEFY